MKSADSPTLADSESPTLPNSEAIAAIKSAERSTGKSTARSTGKSDDPVAAGRDDDPDKTESSPRPPAGTTVVPAAAAKAPDEETTTVVSKADLADLADRTRVVEKTDRADETTVMDRGAMADRTVRVDKSVAADRAAAERAAAADRTAVVDRTAIIPQSPAPPVPQGSRPPRRGRLPEAETRVVGNVNQVPGFARPRRPAWTPMPVRPAARRTGVTILGTTLTRRQAAVGLGVVLTFVLLVGIILVQAFGGDSGKPTGARAAAGASTGKVEPGKSGTPANGGSKSSPAGSAKPSSASPTSGVDVPDGWRTLNGSGWSVPVPKGASGGGGDQAEIKWNNRLLIISRLNGPLGDPVEAAEQQGTSHYRNYRNVGINKVDYHGNAADWEFYYTTRSGNEQHTVKRLFAIDGQTFSIAWYTSPDDWDEAKSDLEAIYQGFAKR